MKDMGMSRLLTRFLKDALGATAVDYGLVVALVAVVMLPAVTSARAGIETTIEILSAMFRG